MAGFNRAITKILKNGGGHTFTNHTSNHFGATQYGISKMAYPELDIRNLLKIRHNKFIVAITGIKYRPAVAEVLFIAKFTLAKIQRYSEICRVDSSKKIPVGLRLNRTLNSTV